MENQTDGLCVKEMILFLNKTVCIKFSSLGYINPLIGRKYLLPLNQAMYHKEGLMHVTSIKPKVPVMSCREFKRKVRKTKVFPIYISHEDSDMC